MRKYNFLFLSIVSALIFNACSNDMDTGIENNDKVELSKSKVTLTQDEFISVSNDNISEITEDDVFSMVTNFANLKASEKGARNARQLNFTVRSKEYLGEKSVAESTRSTEQIDNVSVPIYEVLGENGDQTLYAVVSADRRSSGVIAFFEDFPTDEVEITDAFNHPNTRAMLNWTKIQLIKDIEKVEQTRKELREKTIEKICDKLGIPISEYAFDQVINELNIDGESITRNHEGTQMPGGQIIAQKSPMCQIIWEQGVPYNRACPTNKIMLWIAPGMGFLQDGKVPAGCVTIACMSVEACVERASIGGQPMDWQYYKTNKTLFEAGAGQSGGTPTYLLDRAGNAIKYIYDQLQSQSWYATHTDGTRYVYATASSLGESYIRNNFNYKNYINFDPDIVLASLNENKPVYISGRVYGSSQANPNVNTWDGHAFVIDGYMITSKASTYSLQANSTTTRSQIVQYYDMYWHINLGWGGNSNAYFKLDNDATCTPEFTDKYGRYELIPMKDMQIITHISKK